MKFFYAAVIAIIGLADTVCGISVEVRHDQVYVNNKPVDLQKLQSIMDNDLFTTYEMKYGDSTITITKSKVGKGLSVNTVGPISPEEIEKMKEMHHKIGEDVENNIRQVQENINKFNEQLSERMRKMQERLQSMFSQPAFGGFPFFF